MATCPKCQSDNVVITEEVFTRKGKAFYRFWQTIIVFFFVIFGLASQNIVLGFILAIVGGLTVNVFSLINAGKQSSSKTKMTCLSCKEKTYI